MSELNQPLYLKIYNVLLEEIKTGKYVGGGRLPSEKELAKEFDVSRITSKKALEILANNGYILRMPGKGSFVIEKNNDESSVIPVNKEIIHGNLMIGVIIPDFSDSYGMKLFLSIQNEAYRNNCFIVPYFSNGRQELEEKAINELIKLGVRGIIIMPVLGENYNPKLVRLVYDKFPVVVIDRYLKGIPAAYVGSDNINAAKKATDYLIGLGHRYISFISPPTRNTSALEDRREGFIRSYTEKGIALDANMRFDNLKSTVPMAKNIDNLKADVENIKNLINNNPHITCFLAVEYNIGLIALKAVESLGKKVPEDISILCFDGLTTIWKECFFTHIQQNEEEMGAQAFKLILKQLNGGGSDEKIILKTELIVGKSTMSVESK